MFHQRTNDEITSKVKFTKDKTGLDYVNKDMRLLVEKTPFLRPRKVLYLWSPPRAPLPTALFATNLDMTKVDALIDSSIGFNHVLYSSEWVKLPDKSNPKNKEKKFHTKFKTRKSHVSTSPKVGQVYVKKKDIGFSLG